MPWWPRRRVLQRSFEFRGANHICGIIWDLGLHLEHWIVIARGFQCRQLCSFRLPIDYTPLEPTKRWWGATRCPIRIECNCIVLAEALRSHPVHFRRCGQFSHAQRRRMFAPGANLGPQLHSEQLFSWNGSGSGVPNFRIGGTASMYSLLTFRHQLPRKTPTRSDRRDYYEPVYLSLAGMSFFVDDNAERNFPFFKVTDFE